MSATSPQPSRRLQAIRQILSGSASHKLVLPDLSVVTIYLNTITLDGVLLARYDQLSRTASLALSAVNTPFEKHNTVPKYPVLEVSSPYSCDRLTPEAIWIIIYALFTIKADQETIPLNLQKLSNSDEVVTYLLQSGLGRRHPRPVVADDILVSRVSFWQGAGTQAHKRGWLREYADLCSNFPHWNDFTRNTSVITSHPLRPPKPAPGTVLYRRYCPLIGQMYGIEYIDANSERHMEAFHRWHNDERVNSQWHEAGSMEQHKAYVQRQHEDPHTWSVMGTWDGELMGYFEIFFVKEDHLNQHVPGGAGDYDRGMHLLVGETKFRGSDRANAWLVSMTHYMFIIDPRTQKIMGEPNRYNTAVLSVILGVDYHLETDFDFPHKRSTMPIHLRERFFKRVTFT